MDKDLNKDNVTVLLKELKNALKIKQSDLAKAIDVHVMTISKLENNNILSVKTFFALLNFFQKKGIAPSEFIHKMMNDKLDFFNKLSLDNNLQNNQGIIKFMQIADKIKSDTENQIDNSVRIMKLCFSK